MKSLLSTIKIYLPVVLVGMLALTMVLLATVWGNGEYTVHFVTM